MRRTSRLFALYDQLEAKRKAGELDPPAFAGALRGLDGSLREEIALDIQIQCQVAAAAEWGGMSAEQQEGVDPETIPRQAFLRACDEHGMLSLT